MKFESDMTNEWVEYVGLAVGIFAFLILQIQGIFGYGAIWSYMTIFLLGLLIGRIFYKSDAEKYIRQTLIASLMLIGILLGSYHGHPVTDTVIYLAGAYLSFFLHKNGYVSTTEV